jgi:hypothetical protein
MPLMSIYDQQPMLEYLAMLRDWKPGAMSSTYTLDVPRVDQDVIEIGDPYSLDPELFIADIELGRQMPGWTGTISMGQSRGAPTPFTVVGGYQITFPCSNVYKSIYRYKGSSKSNGKMFIIITDVIARTDIKVALHLSEKAIENPLFDTEVEANWEAAAEVSFADELLEADIEPVFSSTFAPFPNVRSKRFTLMSLLEGTTPWILTWHGNPYPFHVQLGKKLNIDPFVELNLVASVLLDATENDRIVSSSAHMGVADGHFGMTLDDNRKVVTLTCAFADRLDDEELNLVLHSLREELNAVVNKKSVFLYSLTSIRSKLFSVR